MNTYFEYALTFLLGCQSGYILTLRHRARGRAGAPLELDQYLRVLEALDRYPPNGR
jgi:hypothetical protein